MTPALLNTARFSNSILKFEQLPTNTLASPLSFFSPAPFMGAISVRGLTALGNDSTSPSTNNVTYWTYSDDLTYTKGKHLLKTGVLVEHAFSSKQTTTNSRGVLQLREPGDVPRGHVAAVPGRAAGRDPGARAAEHAVRRLRAGRFPRRRPRSR